MKKSTDEFQKFIEKQFHLPFSKQTAKVISLSEAISRFIKPGMTIHTGITHFIPYALSYELARQFWDKDPGFILITLGAIIHANILVKGKMVRKIITSYAGDIYPAPASNRIFNEAYIKKEVEFENWSLLTLSLRLMAGAMGVGFLPTKSLTGSQMALDNSESFKLLADPFNPEKELGVVKALNPDITLMHCLACDDEGNAIMTPPYSEKVWGAMAAREGVILSAEKIISTEEIRELSPFVKLPGAYVKAVCPAPFGGHPGGISNHGISRFISYAEDYAFIVDFRKATKKDDSYDQWLKQWVLGCKDHSEYLERLGYERLLFLMGKANPEAWKYELTKRLNENIALDRPANRMEMMTIAAARIIADRCKKMGFRTILAGIGNSNLAAWLAYCRLKNEGLDIDLVAEVGFYGYEPRPSSPFIFNFANIPTCKILTDSINALGVYVGGSQAKCLGSLGAGQVDKFGNINSTMVPGIYYIVGSGGANDVLEGADEVVLTVPLSPLRYVDKVPYITGRGNKVKFLVSDYGVFSKIGEDREFSLIGYFPEENSSEEEIIKKLRDRCGWKLKIADYIEALSPPDVNELWMIRAFDPLQAFTDEKEA